MRSSSLPPYHPTEPFRLGPLIDSVGADFAHVPSFGVPRACRTPLVITVHDLIHFSRL